MPKKLSTAQDWPTLVQERLTTWGKCIATQRLRQRITTTDLSARLGISRMTLARMEKGDPGAGVGAYLTALLVLGLFDMAVPAVPSQLWQGDYGHRVRANRNKKGTEDDEYF